MYLFYSLPASYTHIINFSLFHPRFPLPSSSRWNPSSLCFHDSKILTFHPPITWAMPRSSIVSNSSQVSGAVFSVRVWLLITMRTPWDCDFLGSPVWAGCHSRTSFSGDNLSKENSFVPSAHKRCHLFNLGVAHRASYCPRTQCLASLSQRIALHLFISHTYFLSTSFTESLLLLLTRLQFFKSFHAAFYSQLSLYPRL